MSKLLFKILPVLYAFILLSCKQKAESSETSVKDYYKEKHRPQFHFSPEAHWMNDPNGMVYYRGEYHLFYQYYPEGDVWGPMHWGHAISKDMIEWEHQPIALYPDSLGLIFSGSVVADEKNTSGLGTKQDPALVALYTNHLVKGEKEGRIDYQNQSIAYSTDKGRTWKKYQHNPVLKNNGIRDFRDPKVFWHEPSDKWVMILAVKDHTELYASGNLIDWTKLSDFGFQEGNHGGTWECPDLFPLAIEGSSQQKWVMLVSIDKGGPNGGSATQYFIGEFDGKRFIYTDKEKNDLWIDYGPDDYAGVTWSGIPKQDGRRIFLGWMSNWSYATHVPTSPWRSAMTVPRTLTLKHTPAGLRVSSLPVKELNAHLDKHKEYPAQIIANQLDLSSDITALSTYELTLEFSDIKDSEIAIELSNDLGQKMTLGYSIKDGNKFYMDRTSSGDTTFSKTFARRYYAGRMLTNESLKLKLLVDHSSLELFADDGLTVMTTLFFPDKILNQLKIVAPKGSVNLKSAEIANIKPVW